MDVHNSNDTKNQDISSDATKNFILSHLHKHIDDVHRPIKNIIDWSVVDNIRDDDYIAYPRHIGTRSWVLFISHDNNYYAVSFPQHNIRKRDNINIYPVDIQASKQLYAGVGTIMEGIYYNENNHKRLIIDNIYYLGGKSQITKTKMDRLNYLRKLIRTKFSFNRNYSLYISRYYTLDRNGLYDLYNTVKSSEYIQEIIFCPSNFDGVSYRYTVLNTDMQDDVVKYCTLNMAKTKSPDVYKLSSLSNGSEVGIAYIPDTKTSKMCKSWYNKRTKTQTVKCVMDINMDKWIPLELVDHSDS